MARPPLALGSHGTIKLSRERGMWCARCRVRDLDGVTWRVARFRSHPHRRAAGTPGGVAQPPRRACRAARPNSRFRDAADIWLGKIRERREDSTLDIYQHWLSKIVLPQLGELGLSECDVAQIDAFFSRLERMRRTVKHKDGSTSEKPHYAASSRRTVRSIVSGILQQAVLHKVIPSNPTRELERIESPRGHHKAPPRGLTAEERRRLLDFVDTNKAAIDADLKDLIRFALGSGLRIGELCAALDGRQPRRLPASQRAAAGKRGAVVAPPWGVAARSTSASGTITAMDLARTQAAADALGSVRAEFLEPSATVEALLARWSRGELSTDQLAAARRLIASGNSVEALLAPTTGG
ncbi:MAG: hypothetical protein ACR2GH_02850 [Pseudonocardia sp.]